MPLQSVATRTYLLILVCWGCVFSGSEAHDGLGQLSSSHWVVSVGSLFPTKACSSGKGSSSRVRRHSLSVSHRDGPCSPISTTSRSKGKEYSRQLLLEDEERVSKLQKKPEATGEAADMTKLQQSAATVPIRRGRALGTGNYIVTVGIGTPKKEQTVAFDTGSSLCWVQCRPCARSCYSQEEPIFDPVASSTYSNVSCDEAACGQLLAKGCSNKTCVYGVRYGDSSFSVGFLSKEALTLTTASGGDDVFQGFMFGCGQNNQGLYGRTAGLLGLSRDSLSLVSQTASRYGNVFSYCLPASVSSTGYLTLGSSAHAVEGISYTPMLSSPKDEDLYFLRMTGITVGGQQLPVSSSDLSAGGTIIDSGTVITRLPPTVYAALRSAFRSAMSEYKLGDPLGLLDTCYDLSGRDTVTLPKIALQFEGGAVATLEAVGVLFIADVSQVCLAFAGNAADSDIGIIGNVQQRTLEVVYDLGQQRIGFAPGTCRGG